MNGVPVDPRMIMTRVAEHRRLSLRALILDTLDSDLLALWDPFLQSADLIAEALGCPCGGEVEQRCPRVELCLPLALWLDDSRPWVAGKSRTLRVAIYQEYRLQAAAMNAWIAQVEPVVVAEVELLTGDGTAG